MRNSYALLRGGIVAALVSSAIFVSGMAPASTVPVTSGPLNLTVSTIAYGSATPGANGNVSALGIPGSYTYADSFTADQAGHPVTGTANGFYDDWVFTISAATVNSVTSTIALTNALSIQGLAVELYSCTTNSCTTAVTGTPSGTYWTAQTLLNSGGVTIEQINAVGLAQGTYAIQVSGTATGNSGGSYSGNLNVDVPATVPLPGGLPLLSGGLLMLAGASLRRRG